MLPDFDRADRIGEFWGYPQSRAFAEHLIDCEEDRTLRAVLVGMLRAGTEHILLGLVREGEGVGAQILQELGASLQQVRTTVIQLLAGYTAWAQEPAGGDTFRTTTEFSSEVPSEGRLTQDPMCPRCSTKLAETLTVKELEVEVGDEQRKVRIAYCGRCGSALGLFA